MIRHIVLLRWKEDADPALVQRFKEGIFNLPSKIPVIRRYSCGENVGSSSEGLAGESGFSDNFDFVVSADLDDYDAYRVYAEHDAHKVWIEEVARKVIGARVAIQYDLRQYGVWQHGVSMEQLHAPG